MKCCIPGCESRSIRQSYAFCPPHWEEYGKAYGGKRSNYPEWLRYLINSNKQEDYADQRNARTMSSLETLIDMGRLDPDQMVPYAGPPRKRRERRRANTKTEVQPEGKLFESSIDVGAA